MLPYYLVVKWLHILAVIALVGLHSVYGVWLVRAYHAREALPFTLRTIAALDTWVATPAVAVLLLSGPTMLAMMGTSPAASWLIVAIILFMLLILAQLALYRPALAELSFLVQRGALDTAEFRRAASRERSIGIVMTAVMLCIVFLMVVKPNLWG